MVLDLPSQSFGYRLPSFTLLTCFFSLLYSQKTFQDPTADNTPSILTLQWILFFLWFFPQEWSRRRTFRIFGSSKPTTGYTRRVTFFKMDCPECRYKVIARLSDWSTTATLWIPTSIDHRDTMLESSVRSSTVANDSTKLDLKRFLQTMRYPNPWPRPCT